jgi:hemerythrin superfamily protein
VSTANQQQDVVQLLIAQHNEVRALIEHTKAAVGPARRAPFEKLVRLLAVHETAEEEVVYPVVRRHVPLANQDTDKLVAMRKQLEVAEKVAPTHPHAGAPESAAGNLVMGPFVAIADRVRDALRGA